MEAENRFRIFAWLVVLCGLVAAVTGFYIGEPSAVMLTYKRSAMDLAMLQVYRICDADKSGTFNKAELQCLQKVLYILVTGR